MLNAIETNFEQVIVNKAKGVAADSESQESEKTATELPQDKTELYKSEAAQEHIRETLFESSLESAKELTLEQEKTALLTLQMFALGTEQNINEYMQKAREYAMQKGIEIFDVLHPDGAFYNEFVNFLQSDEQPIENLYATDTQPSG